MKDSKNSLWCDGEVLEFFNKKSNKWTNLFKKYEITFIIYKVCINQ